MTDIFDKEVIDYYPAMVRTRDATNEVLFRPHRGGLAESMAEFQILTAENTLADITCSFMIVPSEILSITVNPYGATKDTRINWNTHVVMVSTTSTPPSVLGFTNGPVPAELIGL